MTRHLIAPLLRATPWLGFAPAGLIALAMAWVATRQPADTMARLLPTRIAVLGVVIAVAFVFDDTASRLTDPASSPLRHRRLIRALGATIPAGAFVVAIVLVSSIGMDLVLVMPSDDTSPVETEDEPILAAPDPELPPFPGGRIALEAATLIAFTLATAAAVSRRGEVEPGRITTGVLLGVYAASWMIPEPVKPWADPNAQRWDTGAPWWWVALGAFVLAAMAWSWDARVGRVKTAFYLGGRSSILAPWRLASRTTKPTNSPASSQKPPGSP